ncbi:MAG: hypothetical protein ACM3JI_00730, partial [Anaerolineae bacterium]
MLYRLQIFVWILFKMCCLNATTVQQDEASDDSTFLSLSETYVQSFLHKITLNGTEKILDICYREGKTSALLSKRVPRGSVLSIVPSFESDFDLITSFNRLELLIHPKQLLNSLWHSLKPDGSLFLYIPLKLPAPLERALSRLLSDEKWLKILNPHPQEEMAKLRFEAKSAHKSTDVASNRSFAISSVPWTFQSPRQYSLLLIESHLTPKRLDRIGQTIDFKDKKSVRAFL